MQTHVWLFCPDQIFSTHFFVLVKPKTREDCIEHTDQTDSSTTANDDQPDMILRQSQEEDSTKNTRESVLEQHIAQGELSDQRTETPLPERNVEF